MPTTACIPRATYRLQLHEDFDFAQAQAILPYLQALGVSHVYCSPVTRARPGSRHGYDVVDPCEINPELGGREGFERFAAAAQAHGLAILLDIVPNHMGVIGGDNPWWADVLEHGPASLYAGFFDIDWEPLDADLAGRVLLPVLGLPYGQALDQGELRIAVEADGRLVLRYFDHRFPLDAGTWHLLLHVAVDCAEDAPGAEALAHLAAQSEAMSERAGLGSAHARERADAAARLRQGLAALGATAAAALADAVARINAEPSHDALHAVLEAQAWRVGYWRVAADAINYRRFFDINELAALRVEDEAVFEATHALPLDLAAAGLVQGLRIDHPDGLRDPAQYFQRLQQGYARRRALQGRAVDAATLPLYVVAEKITAAHADQPGDWALHGTTGYRFGALVTGLLVDRSQAARMDRIWRGFAGVVQPWDDMVFEAKRAVALGPLNADLGLLAQQLKRIAAAHRRTRDYGYDTLRQAIADTAACMPVYRTYVVEQASAEDRRFVDWAIAQARRRSSVADASVFEFLHGCLLAEPVASGLPETLLALRRFAWRFQQFCAPVAAKGVEDTVFYRHLRLVALNEVGGEPEHFGTSVAAFHGASRDRAARWPHTLLATSTHDNKRSEDVRCRLAALSERPALWRLGLMRWRRLARGLRRMLPEGPAPTPADELLLYQTVLGCLPAGELDEADLAALRERVGAYMVKAAREAKQRTSWVRPDAAYEQALQAFVDGLLGRLAPNPALADLRALAQQLAWFGAWNSLALAVLKCSVPGVPDIYQGNEAMDLSLVDPDNRRPVDYAQRQGTLAALEALLLAPSAERAAAVARMAATPTDGRLKLWAIWRLLALRRACPALFRDGSYLPLKVHGQAQDHVLAFARRADGGVLLVLVGRLFARLGVPSGAVPAGPKVWGDAQVALPPALQGAGGALQAVELLSGHTVPIVGGALHVADALSVLPVAVLHLPG